MASRKSIQILYWVTTIILCGWMVLQGIAFILNANSPELINMFQKLGFSAWIIMPLGIAKLLAVLAILYNKYANLKKLAYVALAVDFILAIYSHLMANDGNWPAPLVALVLLILSFTYYHRLNNV